MSDNPIPLMTALELARKPESPEWLDLLAWMESVQCSGFGDDWIACHRGWKCIVCGVISPDMTHPAPSPVTEPLPCIVDRKMRQYCTDKDNMRSLVAATMFDLSWSPVLTEHWYGRTPAEQLVYLWKAEGRLGK